MLSVEEAINLIDHAVCEFCQFTINDGVKVYLDDEYFDDDYVDERDIGAGMTAGEIKGFVENYPPMS